MTETLTPYAVVDVILTIRGHKVILDRDLAMLYGVEVKRLNEQMKRNRDRFPDDFAFQLTLQEVTNLKSQFATSGSPGMRSQIATASSKRNIRFMPYAFTEHGVIMAATVLNSSKAVERTRARSQWSEDQRAIEGRATEPEQRRGRGRRNFFGVIAVSLGMAVGLAEVLDSWGSL